MVDTWSRSKTMSLHAAKAPRPQDPGDRELCLDCLRKPGWNVGTMAGRGPAVGGLLGRKCHIQGGLKPSPIRSHACCNYTSGVMLPSSTLKWGWRAPLIFLNQNRASRHSPQESLRFAQCGTDVRGRSTAAQSALLRRIELQGLRRAGNNIHTTPFARG
jgi:hypothetical protein